MKTAEELIADMQAKHAEWRAKINSRDCTEFEWPHAAHPQQLGLCEVLVDQLGRFWRVDPAPDGIKMRMIWDPRPPIMAIGPEFQDELCEMMKPAHVVWISNPQFPAEIEPKDENHAEAAIPPDPLGR